MIHVVRNSFVSFVGFVRTKGIDGIDESFERRLNFILGQARTENGHSCLTRAKILYVDVDGSTEETYIP